MVLKHIFKIVLLAAVFCLYNVVAYAVEPFNRHYIVVVDQTIKSSNTNMAVVYESICKWLKGEMPTDGLNMESSTIPEPKSFDIHHDAISLFAFGLSGDGISMNSDYGRIHRDCYNVSKSPESVFRDIVSCLIQKRSRFISGKYVPAYEVDTINVDRESSFSVFLSMDLLELFNGADPLYKSITYNSGITMSHFVYPLIMDFISKEETANEYYLILVSDFKSGLYSNNDEDDWKTLQYMTAGKDDVLKYFKKQINSMRAPFIQADYLHFQAGDIGAKGTRLIMKSLVQKSQIYLSSSLKLSQFRGSVFKVNSAKFVFDKDPLTTIDSIQIVLSEDGNALCRKTIVSGDENINKLLRDNREYEIPSQKVDLGKESLDDISIEYQIYTMSHDASGNPVLPVALSATQNISKDDITMINKELRKTMMYIISALIILAFWGMLIFRGRHKWLELNIGSFAQKYMNVTDDEGAVEMPCWFYHEGETAKSIRVSGTVKRRSLSIGGTTRLFVRLQDAKPNGFKYYIDRKDASDFIKVKKSGSEFSFNINVEMLPNIIDPSKLSTCSVKVDFCVESRLLGFFRRQDVIDNVDDIKFYFLNDLGTAWVGFDPGTTGSCVSFGCTGGSLDDPNIEMVTTDHGEKIIPSKLVLTKDFGDTPIQDLRPGNDYIYGRDADNIWAAATRDGKPCFQSIKKLLGYKNSVDDMIEVNWGRNTRKLSGLQLAHLLVKGLKKELDKNVHALSQADSMRYVGKNGHARRAVVAIPNNYTLPKITDMVNSVRMLGSFDEVRYIYEAEGILFNYFRKNYKTQHPGQETIMVYDMGGATINLSIFQVNYIEENGTIYYDVHTIGRIGYAVGGDNIDVAIMEYLFTLPQLPNTLSDDVRQKYPQKAKESDKQRHDYQLSHKNELLKKIVALKVDIVKAQNSTNLQGNSLENAVVFDGTVNDILQTYSQLPEGAFNSIPEDESFSELMSEKICYSDIMRQYVLSNVKDAVEEILKYPVVEQLSKIDTLIFAGRSTMFPGIKDIVTTTVGQRFKRIKPYKDFDSDEIKTSVSYGACWYGIYNSLVTLDNSRLASAYGFKLTQGGSSHLKVLLNQNDIYGEDGTISNSMSVSNHFDADGNVVDFYQVMGSGKGENLFSESNRHKVNFIGSIDVTTTTSEIAMTVDRRNVVTCEVTFNTGDISQYKDLKVVGRDITKENDWAYVFAATPQTKASDQHQTGQLRSSSSSNQPVFSPDNRHNRPSGNGSRRV